MEYVTGLACVFCGGVVPPGRNFTCPGCGITGILDVAYDYRAVAKKLTRSALTGRERSLWRYRELLPVPERTRRPDLLAGWSPLTEAPALARHLGVRTLLVKDEGRNATGSLKDRASAVGVVKALAARRKIIACASTGNAASSCAGMAASVGMKSVIFVPERAPEAKVAQLLIFGATVLRVRGSYEDAFQLCQAECGKRGWYNRNSGINPYLVEGKKTVSLEIGEQSGWRPTDWVAVSVGDGCTIAGVWKGFQELREIGLIEKTPRILGVQAEGAAPVTELFRHGGELRPIEPKTIADSIAVGVPRNWKKAVRAVRESRGEMINVSDGEILEAMRYTGRLAGVFAEPAAATAIAGLKKAVADGVVGRSASATAIVSGSGLKDVRSALQAAGQPFEVAADGTGLDEILRSREVL